MILHEVVRSGAQAPSATATAAGRRKDLGVKVCPHCAEELPDEATVCSNCLKDPAVAPAWAVPRQPDGFPPSPGNAWEPNSVPRTSDGVPAQYKGLEPEVARNGSLGIPWKVWVSLGLAFGWGLIPISVTPQLGMAGLLLLPVGYVAGLILGNMGRVEVKGSDRVGQILAIIAIGLNAIKLVLTVLNVVPYALSYRGL
jgi:hypothetical protein